MFINGMEEIGSSIKGQMLIIVTDGNNRPRESYFAFTRNVTLGLCHSGEYVGTTKIASYIVGVKYDHNDPSPWRHMLIAPTIAQTGVLIPEYIVNEHLRSSEYNQYLRRWAQANHSNLRRMINNPTVKRQYIAPLHTYLRHYQPYKYTHFKFDREYTYCDSCITTLYGETANTYRALITGMIVPVGSCDRCRRWSDQYGVLDQYHA